MIKRPSLKRSAASLREYFYKLDFEKNLKKEEEYTEIANKIIKKTYPLMKVDVKFPYGVINLRKK